MHRIVNNFSYSVPALARHIELDIKRSKFLSFVDNAKDRDEAESFIRTLREQHPQASHVCWAYIVGPPNTTIRSMSDDGEPSGTAGMPMLKVLQHSELGDVVVAVVRYFGGTKLGTGGLQRAYSDAVAEVLKDLPTQRKVSRMRMTLMFDYEFDGSLGRLFNRYDVADLKTSYAQQIIVTLAIASAELAEFRNDVINTTSGKAVITIND